MDEIKMLIAQLDDADLNVRLDAVCGLGKKKDLRAVPALIKALKDENSNVQYYAVKALGEIGKSAIPALIYALREGNCLVRWHAARELGEIGDISVVPALIEATKDNLDVKDNAEKAISRAIHSSTVPALIEALNSEDIFIRKLAAGGLGSIGDASVIPVLIKTLKDSDRDVRREAANSLGSIKDASAVPALIEALKDDRVDMTTIFRTLYFIIISCKSLIPLLEIEKKLDDGYAALKTKLSAHGKMSKTVFKVLNLKIAIAEKRESLASKRDIILDDVPKPPKKGMIYQEIKRRVRNG